MRNDYIIFNGIKSDEYGLILTSADTTAAPKRRVEKITIPGRSGSLEISANVENYENVPQNYKMAIIRQYDASFSAFKNKMLACRGYCKLEDTLHPEEYRMASFCGPIEPQVTPFNRTGEFTLMFDCWPQRWIKSGQMPIEVKTGSVLYNQWQPARPLLQISGNGSGIIAIGNSTIQVTTLSGEMTIDCEIRNAYNRTENLNNNIIVHGDFPVLGTGETAISFSGGIRTVKIIPRWWKL